MTTKPARERLRLFLKRYPKATAAAAARAIGVSRQRVHQIARDEGLSLTRTVEYPKMREYMGPGRRANG